MQKLELLYEGKAKRIYRTESADMVWVEYKDSATAFNGEKKTITGKGRLNNEITTLLFRKLQEVGIKTHFVEKLSETEQLVKKVSIIPLEVVKKCNCRKSFKRLGMEEGTVLAEPIVEFYFKDDDLGDACNRRSYSCIKRCIARASKRITRYGSTNQSSVD